MKPFITNLYSKMFIFGMILVFFSCEKDLYDIDNYSSSFKAKRISMHDKEFRGNKKLMEKVLEFKNNSYNSNENRYEFSSDYEYFIDEENGIYLQKDSLESYTFPAYKNETDSTLTNIVFNKNRENGYDVIIANYNILMSEVDNLTEETLNNADVEYIDVSSRYRAPELICIDIQEIQYTLETHPVYGSQYVPHWYTIGSYCYWTEGGGSGESFGNNYNQQEDIITTPTSGSNGGGGGLDSAPNPCSTLKKINTINKNAYITNSNNASNSNACDNCEYGYMFKMADNQNTIQPVQLATSSGTEIEIPVGLNIYGATHSHSPNTHQMFSFHDVNTLFTIYLNAHANIKQHSVYMLNNSNGTNYAILIDDFETFANFVNEQLTNTGIYDCVSALNLIENILDRKYKRSNNLEKTFLDFISNAGISMYSPTDSNFNNWQKLSLPTNPNNQVVKTPCN